MSMKKSLLLSAMMLVAGAASISAQNYTSYGFTNVEFVDQNGEKFAPYGVFQKVSANGKYAVGTDMNNFYSSFMWKAENPSELECINATSNRISAFDVTDDGMIVGGYENRPDFNKKDVMYPAYKPLDGEWQMLPIHEDASEYYMNINSEYVNTARAVTPDGKFIAGQGHRKLGETWNSALNKVSDVADIIAYKWEKKDDGYEMTAFDDLATKSLFYNETSGEFVQLYDSVSYDFMVYDISHDGSTIVGTNTASTGGQNPAFIRDGKLYQLFNCGEAETPYEEWTFGGGIISSIDCNGNMYGYFQLQMGEGEYKFFKFTPDNKMVYLDNLVICATADGTQITQGGQMGYPQSVSDDGKVIVGGGVTTLMGESVNTPEVLYDPNFVSGIDGITSENKPGVDYRSNGMLFVDGQYNSAELYSASGALLDSGKQGKVFSLANRANGTYIVKVSTGEGVKSFKVVK